MADTEPTIPFIPCLNLLKAIIITAHNGYGQDCFKKRGVRPDLEMGFRSDEYEDMMWM